MSVASIAAPTLEEGPLGAAAAAQRIQHLQALIAKVEAGPAGFAAALQAAQTSAAQTAATATGATQLTGAPSTAAQTAAGATQLTGAPSTAPQTATAQALPTGAYPVATSPGAIPGASPTTTPASEYSAAGASTLPASGAGAGAQYDALIEQAAARNGIDPAVLHGLIEQESGFDPNSTSSAGALGLTQLMPGTAASLGVANPLDPAQSIEGGARYLGEMLRQFGGSTEDALAAYNAGPGPVRQYGGVPPYSETQQYVTKVLGYADEYRSSHPTAAAPAAASSQQAEIA